MIGQSVIDHIATLQDKISGYFFNVFSLGEQTRNKIFKQFYSAFPDSDKLRMIEGDGHPLYVIKNLLFNGIDMFEASYPFDLVEKGIALCLNFDSKTYEESKEPSKCEIEIKDLEEFADSKPHGMNCE
jgi:hypothetical protein